MPAFFKLSQRFLDHPSAPEFLSFENLLHKEFKSLADVVCEAVLDKVLNDPEVIERCIAEYHQQGYRVHSRAKQTTIQLYGGRTVTVKTVYMLPQEVKFHGQGCRVGQRSVQGQGIYPVLKKLGIAHQASPALQNEVTLSALNNPFMEATDNLNRHGIDLSEKRARTISENTARAAVKARDTKVQQFQNGQLPAGDTFAGQRVVVAIDGGRARTRTPKKGRKKKGQKRQGFYTDWCEPKLFTIYALDEQGNKLTKELKPFIDGTFEDRDAFKVLLKTYLHEAGVSRAAEITFIADGGPWIWKLVDEIIQELELEKDKIHKVLDYYHCCEKLWSIIETLPGLKQHERKRLYKKLKRQLKKGKIQSVIDTLSRKADGKATIIKAINYFHERLDMCRYDVYIERNIPIGSGAIESTIRRVVNLRLKGAGMFWLKENAEAFLHLRCQLKSGRWLEFFQRHLLTMVN